jgi:hypothetical protein
VRAGGSALLKAPTDIFGLFDTQSPDFKPEIYLEHFAAYRWTYVAGFPALIHAMLQAGEGFGERKDVLEYIVGQRGRAIGLLPARWKSIFKDGDWDDFNGAQVQSASKGEPLRLDKACYCILSAELALRGVFNQSLRDLGLYRFVRLRPAVYVLGDLDARQRSLLQPTTLNEEDKELYKKLVEEICALSPEPVAKVEDKAKSFLAVASQGAGMTLPNARLLKRFFDNAGYGYVSVRAMPDRTNAGQNIGAKNCNTAEANFIGIEDDFTAELRKVRRPSTERGNAPEAHR